MSPDHHRQTHTVGRLDRTCLHPLSVSRQTNPFPTCTPNLTQNLGCQGIVESGGMIYHFITTKVVLEKFYIQVCFNPLVYALCVKFVSFKFVSFHH